MEVSKLGLNCVIKLMEAATIARRKVRGTRVSHFVLILVIGTKEGEQLGEAVKVTGLRSDNVWHRLNRLKKLGYIHKVNRRYYLTDKGRWVYNTVLEKVKPSLNELIQQMICKVKVEVLSV